MAGATAIPPAGGCTLPNSQVFGMGLSAGLAWGSGPGHRRVPGLWRGFPAARWACWAPLSRGHVAACRRGGCSLGGAGSPSSAEPRSPERGRERWHGGAGAAPKPAGWS